MKDNNWQSDAVGLRTSRSSSELDDEEDVIVLLSSINEFNNRIYCYLKLPYAKYKIIKEKMQNGQSFTVREYGEVVAAGLDYPTDEVRQEIQEEYGITPITFNNPDPMPKRFEVEDIDSDDFP